MLNKNFLLGCVIAALTACGGQGSLDLGPTNSQYGATPSPTPEPPTIEKTWTWNFEDDSQLASWVTWTEAAQNSGDCNLETSLSLHWQSSALQIAPAEGWQADFEQLCAFGYVDEPVDMAGGSFYMSVYLPSFFTDQNPWNTDADDGPEDDRFNFGIQVMIEDVEGNRGEAAGWVNVYELLGSSFNAEGFGRQQRKDDPVAGDVAGRWFDMRFNAENASGDANISEIVAIGLMITIRDTNLNLSGDDVFGNGKYVFIDNVLLEPNPDYVPPPFVAPTKEPVDFALPVYIDGVESGFSDGWGGWGGSWTWGESLVASFDGSGNSGLQIGSPDPIPDVSVYNNFHFSAYGEDGSGTTTLEVSLCDCDGAAVEVDVVGGEWTDFTIPVADFTDTSLAAIRIQNRGTTPVEVYFDNIGFDLVEGGPGGVLPLTRGWAVEGAAVGPVYGNVSYVTAAVDDQLNYVIEGPIDFTGGSVTFGIAVEQAYIDSGATLQPFVQSMFGDWIGQWDCAIENANLSTTSTSYVCNLTEDFNVPEGESIKLGLLAKGEGVAGMVTVTGVDARLEDATVVPVDMNKGWAIEGGSNLAYGEQLAYIVTGNDGQLNYVIEGPVDLSGALIIFDIAVSQSYIGSGANLQPFAQSMFGDWPGQWDCAIDNANLSTTSIRYECQMGAGFNVPLGESIKIGMLAKGDSVTGTVRVNHAEVQLAVNQLPLTQGWVIEGEANGPVYGTVSYVAAAVDDQLNYVIDGPIDLTGGEVIFDIEVEQAYIDTGATLQPYVQSMFGDWIGQWDCAIENADLSTTSMSYTCPLTENFNVPEGEQIKIGMLAKGAGVAGAVTVTGISVSLSDATPVSVDLHRGWAIEGESASGLAYGQQVAYRPTANDGQLNFQIEGPVDLSGTTLYMDLIASQAYIDSGANLQPFVQSMFGDWPGQWDCAIDNADLSTTVSTYECVIGAGFDIPEGERIKVGLLAKGDGLDGSVKVTSVRYVIP